MRTGKRWWAVDLPTWLLLSGETALVEQVDERRMMPVDPELLELYVDEVWIEPYVSTDFNNVDTFGASIKYAAKIDAKIEEVLRKTGDVAVSSHRVALDDVYEIDEKDRITMPSNARFKVANPEIVAVYSWTDEKEITATALGHHTTVWVGARKGARA
jgi:hypothetical protein